MRICEPLGLGPLQRFCVIYISIATLAFEDIGKHRLAFYFFGICKCFELLVQCASPGERVYIGVGRAGELIRFIGASCRSDKQDYKLLRGHKFTDRSTSSATLYCVMTSIGAITGYT